MVVIAFNDWITREEYPDEKEHQRYANDTDHDDERVGLPLHLGQRVVLRLHDTIKRQAGRLPEALAAPPSVINLAPIRIDSGNPGGGKERGKKSRGGGKGKGNKR